MIQVTVTWRLTDGTSGVWRKKRNLTMREALALDEEDLLIGFESPADAQAEELVRLSFTVEALPD